MLQLHRISVIDGRSPGCRTHWVRCKVVLAESTEAALAAVAAQCRNNQRLRYLGPVKPDEGDAAVIVDLWMSQTPRERIAELDDAGDLLVPRKFAPFQFGGADNDRNGFAR